MWEKIQRFLKLRAIPLKELPCANTGNGEANAVPKEVRTQLRKLLSGTASGVKERYGIDWGWD